MAVLIQVCSTQGFRSAAMRSCCHPFDIIVFSSDSDDGEGDAGSDLHDYTGFGMLLGTPALPPAMVKHFD